MIIGFGPLLFLTHFSKLKIKNLFFFNHFNNLLAPIIILVSPVILLFAMGYDWGRWVNISYTFSFLFYYYLYKNNLITIKIIYPIFLKRIINKKKLFIFIFIIFCFGWNPKTTITGDVASFPGYRIPVKIINKILFDHY